MIKKCLLILILFCASACSADSVNIGQNCTVESPLPVTNSTHEAQEYLTEAFSYDIDIIQDRPDVIPPAMRDRRADRAIAREYYQKAADLGNLQAMNNLSGFLLEGFGRTDGTYEPEPAKAFALYGQMAAQNESRGFQGLSAMLLQGFPGQPRDESKAVTCMRRAAQLATPDNPEPIRLLAELDIRLSMGEAISKPIQEPHITRGLTLLEELIRRDNFEAYKIMVFFYKLEQPDPLRAEFYSRESVRKGSYIGTVGLYSGYKTGAYGPPNSELASCADELTKDNLTQVETLCPRPGGPLTREVAGLPPVPEPLDVNAYLADFAKQYPDL